MVKRFWKVVGTALGVAVAGCVLVFGWVVASFSGGIDDLLDADKPQQGDPEVVAAEESAYDDVEAETERTVATLSDAVQLRTIGGGLARRPCDVGQHNFKIDDDYDLSCSLTGVRVLAGAATPATAETVRALDRGLTAAGWRRVGPAGVEADLPGAGWVDVPPLRYVRSEEKSWQLVVDQARGSSIGYELDRGSGVELEDDGRGVALEELIAQTPPQGYGVVVMVSLEYFRN